MLDDIDGYIAGVDTIDKAAIQAAPKSLKVISRYGAGFDRVDIDAANAKGITVTNTPGVNSIGAAWIAALSKMCIRDSAYGDEKHNISENWLEENNFRNLLDERGRELYWEGIRRTDLVRFDLI